MTRSLESWGAALAVALLSWAAASAEAQSPRPASSTPVAPAIAYGDPNGSYAPVYPSPSGRPVAAPAGRAPESVFQPTNGVGSYASSTSAGSSSYVVEPSDGAVLPPYGSCGGCGSCGACNSCTSCDSCDSCCDSCDVRDEKVFLFFTPSERCFESFIFPVTNTVLWEDPRTLTGVRALYIRQSFPNSSVFGGGHVDVFAMQARAALTERLSIIATKDGYIELNPGVGALGGDGFANLAAGLKYNLIRDVENATLVSAGFTFEIPLGTNEVFQGNGNGDFHFFMSGATEITDWSNWIMGSGFRIPGDNNLGTQLWYLSNHVDIELVSNKVFAFAEFNWYHWMSSGAGPISGFEGGDLLNLGSADVAGNDIVTCGVGPAFKLLDGSLEISAAYEFPLTNRRDLLDDRVTATVLLNF